MDPDQGVVGLHVKIPEVAPRLRIQPSFELGFGGGTVLGAANLDLLYIFHGSGVTPYAGGGPTIGLYDRENRDSDLVAGINLVGGLEWGRRRQYLFEVRVGFGDIPAMKAVFGIDF